MCQQTDVRVEDAEIDDALLALFRRWKNYLSDLIGDEEITDTVWIEAFLGDMHLRLTCLEAGGKHPELFGNK